VNRSCAPGPLFADDDPHPGRPVVQAEQPGDVRDPGPVADLAVDVAGRRPRRRGHFPDRGLHVLGDRHADRVAQPPRRGRQPGKEPVGAAPGVRADQRPAPQAAGQLGQGQPGGLDVVGGGVRAGVPGSEHDREGLPVPGGPVVGPGGHRVEPERLTVD
jgi:hypothetical protein